MGNYVTIGGIAAVSFTALGWTAALMFPQMNPAIAITIFFAALVCLITSFICWALENSRRKSSHPRNSLEASGTGNEGQSGEEKQRLDVLAAAPTKHQVNSPFILTEYKSNGHLSDSRKAKFDDGTKNDIQIYNEKLSQRLVSETLFNKIGRFGPKPVRIKVSRHSQSTESGIFESSVVTKFRQSGHSVQHGFYHIGASPLMGVEVRYAPNESSEMLAEVIASEFKVSGMTVSLQQWKHWGNSPFIEIAVGDLH